MLVIFNPSSEDASLDFDLPEKYDIVYRAGRIRDDSVLDESCFSMSDKKDASGMFPAESAIFIRII